MFASANTQVCICRSCIINIKAKKSDYVSFLYNPPNHLRGFIKLQQDWTSFVKNTVRLYQYNFLNKKDHISNVFNYKYHHKGILHSNQIFQNILSSIILNL